MIKKCDNCKYKQTEADKRVCYISEDGKFCYKKCQFRNCDKKNEYIVVQYKRRDRGNFHDANCRLKEVGLKKTDVFQQEIASGKRGPNGETLYIKCPGPGPDGSGKEHWFWTRENPTGRKIYCSQQCSVLADDRKNKAKQTCIEKYGVEYAIKSDVIKEKIKQTNREKYGFDYALSNNEVINKRIETNLEKYGVKNPMQNKEIRKRQEETVLKRYGVKNVSCSTLIKNKKEETSMENYGVKYHTSLSAQKEKVKNAMIEKYGIENICQKDIANIKNYNKEYIEKHFIEDGYFLFHECKKYFNIKQDTTVHRMKRRFNIIFPNKRVRSIVEKEIADFIKSFYNKQIKLNDFEVLNSNFLGRRNPLELDIYLPDDKLAIEFDGLMYHSYGKSEYRVFDNWDELDENKHLSKTLNCEAKGVQLLHIFENEWIDKQEIWKSIIKTKLGYVENKINARDCEIRELETLEEKSFLERCNMQGYIHASISYGLYHEDKLVQVMTFGKSRFNKKYDWELIRECSELYTIVRGGYSKLLKYFHDNHEGTLISYANRRWSSSLTNKNGVLIKATNPNHFYFLPNEYILYSRTRLPKVENYNKDLTKSENIVNNGYRIIYDCGNLLYEL